MGVCLYIRSWGEYIHIIYNTIYSKLMKYTIFCDKPHTNAHTRKKNKGERKKQTNKETHNGKYNENR